MTEQSHINTEPHTYAASQCAVSTAVVDACGRHGMRFVLGGVKTICKGPFSDRGFAHPLSLGVPFPTHKVA